MSYQSAVTKFSPPTSKPVACTLEAKICPDGSAVGRGGPNCEFEECPSTDDGTTQTFCGGIAGKMCPSGYYCKYEGTYPDAGGACLKEETSPSFICPKNGWINCMPIVTDEAKKNCSKEAVEWYKSNCPNFEGVAY
jgi:hypothetical protein